MSRAKLKQDKELIAIKKIGLILEGLAKKEGQRVLRYVSERFLGNEGECSDEGKTPSQPQYDNA